MSFLHDSVKDKIIWYSSVPSTNETAIQLAKQGADDGTIVASRIQTSGKGRRGRAWSSDVGGAWFSIILRPNTSPRFIQRLSMIAALAASYAINDPLYETGKKSLIKWPNDIMIGNKKVGGILLESSVSGDKVEYVVIGIGVNVLQEVMDKEVAEIATSLFIEGCNEPDIRQIIDSFHKFFMRGYPAFLRCDPERDENCDKGPDFFWDSFKQLYRMCSATLGSDISVIENDGSYSARAIDIGPMGELIVELEGGEQKSVYAADVSVR